MGRAARTKTAAPLAAILPPDVVDTSRPLCANSGRSLNGEVEFVADSAGRLRAEAKLSGSNPIWRAAVDENDKYVSPLAL
jgi:hypothetical protein